MWVYLFKILVGGGEEQERLFILLGSDYVGDGYNAVEVWANPTEPAIWLVDDEPTFIRSDRMAAPPVEVGLVSRVILSVTDPVAMRRASEVDR